MKLMGRKIYNFFRNKKNNQNNKQQNNEKTKQKEYLVKLLYKQLVNFYGEDDFIDKAKEKNVLQLLKSPLLSKQITALEKIVYKEQDENFQNKDLQIRLDKLKEKVSDLVAKSQVKKNIEKKIAQKMKKREQEYLNEIKKEIVKENKNDNIGSFKKLIQLDKKESKSLNRSSLEMVKPDSLDEVIGQKQALKSLVSKIASPYPQHVILYGPPGVGKTTAARLTLQEAKKRNNTPFYEDSSFVEVDGTTLRWDPREMTNSLLGSVHDPIYQGAKKGLAAEGVPEPKTGLVTEAHGGILFIDEIGELDPMLQNKLLKVMEDKKVTFESSYYDTNSDDIPLYIQKLFEEGAPADFVLIGATTQSPKKINPALRSRSTEVYFNPLNKRDIEKIITNAASRLNVNLVDKVPVIISKYTVEARKAINLLLDAYSLALYEKNCSKKITITENILYEAIQNRRMSPNQRVNVTSTGKVGKVFGLGVHGFLGSVVEVEAVAFNSRKKGKGELRFNETAGSMAKDSFFNAASVVRKITDKDLNDYDIHVNIVGGGNIDGPSAGVSILMAILSAIKDIPLRQDIAFTGEVSIQGKVKPVGGLREKIYAVEQASLNKVIIPEANAQEIKEDTEAEIIPVSNIEEAMEKAIFDKNK